MRKTEERQRTGTYTAVVECRCDLCGVVAHDTNNWGGCSYRVDQTELKVVVKQREGSEYPEGGNGTEYVIDLCPKCFKERLVPWLQSQGANIAPVEWDY